MSRSGGLDVVSTARARRGGRVLARLEIEAQWFRTEVGSTWSAPTYLTQLNRAHKTRPIGAHES
mgnify:CR=1 FL=1